MFKDIKNFIVKKSVIHTYEQIISMEDDSIYFCLNNENQLVHINSKNNYNHLKDIQDIKMIQTKGKKYKDLDTDSIIIHDQLKEIINKSKKNTKFNDNTYWEIEKDRDSPSGDIIDSVKIISLSPKFIAYKIKISKMFTSKLKNLPTLKSEDFHRFKRMSMRGEVIKTRSCYNINFLDSSNENLESPYARNTTYKKLVDKISSVAFKFRSLKRIVGNESLHKKNSDSIFHAFIGLQN